MVLVKFVSLSVGVGRNCRCISVDLSSQGSGQDANCILYIVYESHEVCCSSRAHNLLHISNHSSGEFVIQGGAYFIIFCTAFPDTVDTGTGRVASCPPSSRRLHVLQIVHLLPLPLHRHHLRHFKLCRVLLQRRCPQLPCPLKQCERARAWRMH